MMTQSRLCIGWRVQLFVVTLPDTLFCVLMFWDLCGYRAGVAPQASGENAVWEECKIGVTAGHGPLPLTSDGLSWAVVFLCVLASLIFLC
jgi:hypothetical protein